MAKARTQEDCDKSWRPKAVLRPMRQNGRNVTTMLPRRH